MVVPAFKAIIKPATTKQQGDRAEDDALKLLQQAGLRLLERNYRTPGRGGGEIDLAFEIVGPLPLEGGADARGLAGPVTPCVRVYRRADGSVVTRDPAAGPPDRAALRSA